MSSVDLASAGSEAEPVLRFGHWPAVRRCALALYFVGFVVWSYHYGIPVQRELVIAWVCGALACASGVMVVSEQGQKALGVQPMARVHHMTMMASDPVIMLETPLPATERALQKAGMKIDDIDLFEVNEAFASVPTAWLKTTGADPARLNVNGGAIALGHPLGGSGTKLMTTLLYALKQNNKRYGLQTMCEGGGMANVTIVERL